VTLGASAGSACPTTSATIGYTPAAGGKTRVDLVHAGYPSKGECYERSIEGWAYFLKSLAQYATTGEGAPFGAGASAAAPANTAVAS
jgi:hypothetical protein